MVTDQEATDGGDADGLQLMQEDGGEVELTVVGQLLGHPSQVRGEALSTDVVEAFRDDA
jgi:hypothetical protein